MDEIERLAFEETEDEKAQNEPRDHHEVRGSGMFGEIVNHGRYLRVVSV